MLAFRRKFHLVEAVRRWRSGEAGLGDALVAIIVLPFMMAMIFVLLEIGFNMRFRASVDSITQDATRGIAQDGALYWDATSTLGSSYGPNGWQEWGRQQLQSLCDTSGRCKAGQAPTMACNVAGGAGPLPNPGEPVNCTATFPYKPLASFTSTNPIFNLGFGSLWDNPIQAQATSRTVVGTG